MKLENAFISVEISNQGAEILSLFDKQISKEWMWDANPDFWPQRSPILFPVVGSTFDQKIRLGKQVFQLGNHGFARYANFETKRHTETSIELELHQNQDTLKNYPFNFRLNVLYCLHTDHLEVSYRVFNDSDVDMPFNFGLHPAFRTQYNGEDGAQEIHFPIAENQLPDLIEREDHKRLSLNDAFFEKVPTLMLEGIKSPYVELIEEDASLRVDVMGYRYLAFWKKPKANFICIEPWHSHDDFEAIIQDFSQREGTLILKPNRSYTTYLKLWPKANKGARYV
jgi:galactose mutarotase-like enzyme